MRKTALTILAFMLLSSCSYIPFMGKKADTKTTDTKKAEEPAAKQEAVKDQKAETDKKPQKPAELNEPSPGDIKVIDGVEYIYARNRKYMLTPYEPEYVWIRKDQYAPGLGENLLTRDKSAADKKAQSELDQRIAKLEEELRKKNIAPQMAYPAQMGYLPMGVGGYPVVVTFTYPSPGMKRRVIVLPVDDQSNYKNEALGELAVKRLINRLENTGTIISVDPHTTNVKEFTRPENMKVLNEVFGIQAILKITLSDVYTSTSKIEGKDEKEASFAMSKVGVDVMNTDTGAMLKQFSGRNPVFLSREKGDLSLEKAKMKAIDLSIELIADDVLKAVLSLDWHARIASIDGEKIYINAGRLSGLQPGKVVEVYSPGEKIIDSKTNMSLGTPKGSFKGELEIVELFGVDACSAKLVNGKGLTPNDLVYIKQK